MVGLVIILGLGGLLLFIIHLANSIPSTGPHIDSNSQTVDAIDSLLPQTQCGKCHYSGCRPYAKAIALGKADIYQCPPGGESTVKAIAQLIGQNIREVPVNIELESVHHVAYIDEDLCIGCVKCIKECPVDAIMGAQKLMHTVIKKYCTGCDLCVPSCPVDCISMVQTRIKTNEWVWSKPDPSSRQTS